MKNRVKILVIALGISALGTPAPESKAEDTKSLYLNLGGATTFMSKYSGSSSAATSLFGSFEIVLGLKFIFPLGSSWLFEPSFGLTPLGKDAADGAATTRRFWFGIPFGLILSSVTNLKLGPGLYVETIGGAGGTINLNNGPNGTATFALPGGSASSKEFYLDLGAGFNFTPAMRLDADFFIVGPLTARRSLGFLLMFGVGFL